MPWAEQLRPIDQAVTLNSEAESLLRQLLGGNIRRFVDASSSFVLFGRSSVGAPPLPFLNHSHQLGA